MEGCDWTVVVHSQDLFPADEMPTTQPPSHKTWLVQRPPALRSTLFSQQDEPENSSAAARLSRVELFLIFLLPSPTVRPTAARSCFARRPRSKSPTIISSPQLRLPHFHRFPFSPVQIVAFSVASFFTCSEKDELSAKTLSSSPFFSFFSDSLAPIAPQILPFTMSFRGRGGSRGGFSGGRGMSKRKEETELRKARSTWL